MPTATAMLTHVVKDVSKKLLFVYMLKSETAIKIPKRRSIATILPILLLLFILHTYDNPDRIYSFIFAIRAGSSSDTILMSKTFLFFVSLANPPNASSRKDVA